MAGRHIHRAARLAIIDLNPVTWPTNLDTRRGRIGDHLGSQQCLQNILRIPLPRLINRIQQRHALVGWIIFQRGAADLGNPRQKAQAMFGPQDLDPSTRRAQCRAIGLRHRPHHPAGQVHIIVQRDVGHLGIGPFPQHLPQTLCLTAPKIQGLLHWHDALEQHRLRHPI